MKGDDLVEEDDPLIAEIWASGMLGTFYKLPLPIDVRDDFEKSLVAGLLKAIAEAEGPKQLAVLRALSAVAAPPIGSTAQARADDLSRHGLKDPSWANEIGKAEFIDAWMTEDPYGDQRAYYATFRYPGREPHTISALYDLNLGGIVKDSFAGYTKGDLRSVLIPEEEGVRRVDAVPEEMAREVLAGVAMGDMYVDNDWSEDFKKTRALLIARMRGLVNDAPPGLPDDQEPLPDKARRNLIEEFLHSGHATGLEEEEGIVDHCLSFRCEHSDGDPLRWSPIGVELFMMDYLPRKVSLHAIEIRNLPAVLKAWVRFALLKRGLEERWIVDAEAAVDRWAPKFKREVVDPENFGMAKAIGSAMMAAGVDLTDKRAVDEWIDEFNKRPFVERDEFLGDR